MTYNATSREANYKTSIFRRRNLSEIEGRNSDDWAELRKEKKKEKRGMPPTYSKSDPTALPTTQGDEQSLQLGKFI
jgi:hypothetical protein